MGSPQSVLDPKISIIIPVNNASELLHKCLTAVNSSEYENFECIVVDDCSLDDSPAVAMQYGCTVIELIGGPFGPSNARNLGAENASGEIVFFIDSDVIVYPDTVTKIAGVFRERPDTDALFGSYDDAPGDGDFLSQYKNLFHHYVHQHGQEEAGTFWTGCGAIRRQTFLRMGGFDVAKYPRPSIEDIDLGRRLNASGHKVYLDKDLQVKHMKRWTLPGLIKTDLLDRGIPWTRLILREKNMPNDLNLSGSQRISAGLLALLLLYLAAASLVTNSILLPIASCLFIIMVSGWQLKNESRLYRMTVVEEGFVYFFLLVLGFTSIYLRSLELLIPLSIVVGIMMLGKFIPTPGMSTRRMIFVVLVTTLWAVYFLIVFRIPQWVAIPVVMVMAVIVLLNLDFYRFFSDKRGLAFATAVFPFHMLYYLYSMVSLFAGTALHIWESKLKPYLSARASSVE